MSEFATQQQAPAAADTVELDRAEALQLLADTDYGRVVFTRGALPAIRAVNHLLDNNEVIIYTALDTTVSTVDGATTSGVVLAYEADDFDPRQRTGWSVTVTGMAYTVTEPERLTRYRQLIHPWIGAEHGTALAIRADIVTGVRILAMAA